MALAADARTSQPATTHFSNGIPPVSPAPSHADDLTDRIRNALLLHDRHEQKYRQELAELQRKNAVELESLSAELKNAEEMHQKLLAENAILYERIRQLEARPNDAGRLSALPTDLDAQKAHYFTQTVLGVFHEPKGPVPERHRPVRSATTVKNDPQGKPESTGDGRRASKRQKINPSAMDVDPSPPASFAPSEVATQPDASPTAHLVTKSGTRIRLKPIAQPGAHDTSDDPDDDDGVHPGQKRPRSPASSIHTAPKPKKQRTQPNKNYHKIVIPPIPRDKNGVPLLPLQVGTFTLYNLGEILTLDDKAVQKAIYPIGYKCERRWIATGDPAHMSVYTCTIHKGPDPKNPIFRVTPENGEPEEGHTTTAAWWKFHMERQRHRGDPTAPKFDGDEMFGLHEKPIRALLQELPKARKLRDYVWQSYIEETGPVKKRRGAPLVQHIPLNQPNSVIPDHSNGQPQSVPHRVPRDGATLPVIA